MFSVGAGCEVQVGGCEAIGSARTGSRLAENAATEMNAATTGMAARFVIIREVNSLA
jgi:hypothetical protein